jgi:hypothetical protein
LEIGKMKIKHSLKKIVSNTEAILSYVCAGKVYYTIDVEDSTYQLEINSMDEEWNVTYLWPKFKAITLMRWIRKGMEDGTFIQIK